MRRLFLIDNSVTQRFNTSPAVREAVRQLPSHGRIASCMPQVLEEGFSARDDALFQEIISHNLVNKVLLPPVPELFQLALDLQRGLVDAGMGKAVGETDLQIAATALHYSNDDQHVEIVHYDSDFDHLAAIEPRLRTRWIVPRGSVL